MAISTLTITLADLAETTIQSAVATANGFSGTTTINFASTLSGGTVLLTAALQLGADIVIDGDTNGDGKADITLSGQDQVRVFWVNVAGADVTLKSLNIIDGKGVGTFGSGGAIATNAGTTLKVVNSTISGSHSDNAGGAIAAEGNLTLVNSTLYGNDADVRGGAIYMFGGKDLTLVNTTITGNSADFLGGGISAGDQGTVTATNSTIAGNSAGDEGGGIELGQFRVLKLDNTIVAGNTAPNNANVVLLGPSWGDIYANHSIVGSDVTITVDTGSSIVADTGIVAALADNGGVVMTMAPTLIAVDKGGLVPFDTLDADRDGFTNDDLSIDARGSARLLGSAVDIGAHERIGGPFFTSSITEDGAATVDNLALHTSLGTAIMIDRPVSSQALPRRSRQAPARRAALSSRAHTARSASFRTATTSTRSTTATPTPMPWKTATRSLKSSPQRPFLWPVHTPTSISRPSRSPSKAPTTSTSSLAERGARSST